MIGLAFIDDIDYYNQVHEMFDILSSENNRRNNEVEGFGSRWDSVTNYDKYTTNKYQGIAGGASISVCFKPLCGLFAQIKYIPLMWSPITLEFEIVASATASIVSPITSGVFTPENTSTSWQIQDVRIICDVVTLDTGSKTSYA